MIGVCVSGARGRMGRMLMDLVAEAEDLELASGLERSGHPDIGMQLGDRVQLTDDARRAIEVADVLLDFSLPDSVTHHVGLAAGLLRPVVSGTTGLDPSQLASIQAAAQRIPVVLASNMSRGIHLLARLVRMAASVLPGYDAEIFEIHHRNKVDAPSGTALHLAEVLRAEAGVDETIYARQGPRKDKQVGLASVRGGDVVGEHQVMFLGDGDQLILTHRATSRKHFCRGALDAVRFAKDRAAGLYGMDDVFEEC